MSDQAVEILITMQFTRPLSNIPKATAVRTSTMNGSHRTKAPTSPRPSFWIWRPTDIRS
jgi:hypothetical protein